MADPTQSVGEGPDLAHHRLSIKGRVGELDLLVNASFSAPWTVLFGPSGCGKSTILRAVCGLMDHLTVQLQRRFAEQWTVLQGTNHSTPPERRHIAYAPQHAALFPHLTVLENVSFAGAVRPDQPDTRSLVREAMELFQLGPLATRLPRHLSGGERQRVSLARALAVPDASLVLLDEPFAGMDRALRDELIPQIQTWLVSRNIPVISVTHDVDEPLLLAAEVIRIEDGRNTAQGPAHHVLAEERTRLLKALHELPDTP